MKAAWVLRARVCVGVCVAVAAVAVVSGGSAGNRQAEWSFDAVPGPGRVTYAENIAHRAAFTNVGKSTFTHVAFRMRVPQAVVGGTPVPTTALASTCPTTPVVVQTAGGSDWVCSFGKLRPGTPGVEQLVLSVVWQTTSPSGSPTTCSGCLMTNGRWTIKEGVNDTADPNDAFPAGGKNVAATLLDASSGAALVEAGGYELPTACTDPLGAGSLRTKQAVNAANKVSTTVCLPTFAVNGPNLGLATTILESDLDDGNPAGHPSLGRSAVCVAALGQNCGTEGSYTPFVFATPISFVFRISGAALSYHDKITQVFHNGQPLPACPSADPNGCYTSIAYDKWTKVWTVQAQARSNGLWGW